MKKYIAPEITVVSFKAEHGYALSNITPEYINEMALMGLQQLDDGSGNEVERSLEFYDEHNDWGDDGSNTFFF